MQKRFIFFTFILMAACSAKESIKTNLIETGVQEKNMFAEGFQLIRFKNYIQISIINPETKEVDFEYYIGKGGSNTAIQIPDNPSRVIALSATHIGMMDELDLSNRIVGVSSENYICSENVMARIMNKSALTLGDIGSSDIEGYLAANSDLIITSGFDNKAPILKKMKSAGLTLFTNYDWKETHPLGRAEWIKVFGVLFNKEAEAKQLFKEISQSYHEIAAMATANTVQPSVLVGTMYGDVFNAPAGDSYMAKLLLDANVDYVYAATNGVGSLSLSLENIISTNRSTAFWLNPAAQNNNQILQMNTRFELLQSFQNGNVYSYYSNVNCFWERSAISPHLLLEDLCKIFYPEMFTNDKLTFYSVVEQ